MPSYVEALRRAFADLVSLRGRQLHDVHLFERRTSLIERRAGLPLGWRYEDSRDLDVRVRDVNLPIPEPKHSVLIAQLAHDPCPSLDLLGKFSWLGSWMDQHCTS
jgi:hypothetical protein